MYKNSNYERENIREDVTIEACSIILINRYNKHIQSF